MLRTTYTYSLMKLSPEAYNEIAEIMRKSGYDHAFGPEGEIDMHGIAVKKKESESKTSLIKDDPDIPRDPTISRRRAEALKPFIDYALGLQRQGMLKHSKNVIINGLLSSEWLELVEAFKPEREQE